MAKEKTAQQVPFGKDSIPFMLYVRMG